MALGEDSSGGDLAQRSVLRCVGLAGGSGLGVSGGTCPSLGRVSPTPSTDCEFPSAPGPPAANRARKLVWTSSIIAGSSRPLCQPWGSAGIVSPHPCSRLCPIQVSLDFPRLPSVCWAPFSPVLLLPLRFFPLETLLPHRRPQRVLGSYPELPRRCRWQRLPGPPAAPGKAPVPFPAASWSLGRVRA